MLLFLRLTYFLNFLFLFSNPSNLLLRIWPLVEFLCFFSSLSGLGCVQWASMYPSVGQDTPSLRGIWRLEELWWCAASWEEARLVGYFLVCYLESSCVVFIFWTLVLSLLPFQKAFLALLMNMKVSFVVPQLSFGFFLEGGKILPFV